MTKLELSHLQICHFEHNLAVLKEILVTIIYHIFVHKSTVCLSKKVMFSGLFHNNFRFG